MQASGSATQVTPAVPDQNNNELLDALVESLPENGNADPPTITPPANSQAEKEVMDAVIDGIVEMENNVPSSDPNYTIVHKHSDVLA